MRVLVISADRSTPTGVPSNLGDALLTDALLKALQLKGCDARAVDFGGKRLHGSSSRTYVGGVVGLAKMMLSADLTVLGGGTLLQDDTTRFLGGLPRLTFVVSALGWIMRRNVVYFGVGCDPVSRRSAALLLRFALWRRTVWARDEKSAERCRVLGGSDVRLGADVSLLLDTAPPNIGEVRTDRYAVVALNAADAGDFSVSDVMGMRRHYGKVLFVQMDQREDVGDASNLSDATRQQLDGVTWEIAWWEAAAVIESASLVVASRMHAMYLAILMGTPVIGVGFASKVVSFCNEFRINCASSVNEAIGGESWKSADVAAVSAARRRAAQALEELVVSARARVGLGPAN